jgi:pimeloyl-ACP methyl ester carboxylesterase
MMSASTPISRTEQGPADATTALSADWAKTVKTDPGQLDVVPAPQPIGIPNVLDQPPGYHQLHPNVSVNFQLNRWLGWMTPQALPDVAQVARDNRGYAELTSAFLALGDRLLTEGRRLDAAFCYRAAEFFLLPGDQRRAPTRRRFLELVRGVYGIGAQHLTHVPYEGGRLPTYRFGTPRKGTVVIFGGFDSYIEEFFPLMLAFAHTGYQVVCFEGPGQGGALEDSGLVLTPQWHRPVGAVLDHFGLEQVTLLGISLGGGLAIRAAAQEPRVARVIADDILTDFLAANLRQIPAAARTAVRALRAVHAAPLLDGLVARRARRDLLTSWGITQGEHVLGVSTPHEYFALLAHYRTADVSALVRADVLLLAGAEDHYVPLRQLSDQLNTLTSARSVTTRVFTRHEQAQNHVQVGNLGLSVRVMLDWLDGLDERDHRLSRV